MPGRFGRWLDDARLPVVLFVLTRGAELVDVASADPGLYNFSTLDSRRFLAAARLIAGGDLWCGKAAFEFAPLYAYYLATFQFLGLGVGWVYASQLISAKRMEP